MAYAPYSSTAPNPPVLFHSPVAFGSTQHSLAAAGSTVGGGGRLWLYNSTHTQATIGTSDFWSDGRDLGAHVHDVVVAIGPSAVSFHRVTAIGSTFASLSAGLSISSAS